MCRAARDVEVEATKEIKELDTDTEHTHTHTHPHREGSNSRTDSIISDVDVTVVDQKSFYNRKSLTSVEVSKEKGDFITVINHV